MMKQTLFNRTVGAALLVCAWMYGHAAAASTTVAYDNTSNLLNLTYNPGNGIEFGDEVFLDGDDPFTINEFLMGTYKGTTVNGDEKVIVRFRLNDGVGGSPDTLLFASNPLNVPAGGQDTGFDFAPISLPAGVENFTWTAEFSGVDRGEEVGLVVAHPPTIGASFTDFWQLNQGTWQALSFNDAQGQRIPASFSARVSVQVPDAASTAMLFGFGAVGLMFCARRRHQAAAANG